MNMTGDDMTPETNKIYERKRRNAINMFLPAFYELAGPLYEYEMTDAEKEAIITIAIEHGADAAIKAFKALKNALCIMREPPPGWMPI